VIAASKSGKLFTLSLCSKSTLERV
jgi:hypothetical protein